MNRGNDNEITTETDDSEDDFIQDPLALVSVNYDEDGSKDPNKNDKVIIHDLGEDSNDGLVYDPEVVGCDPFSTHLGNPYSAYQPFQSISSSDIPYSNEKPPYSFNSLIAMAIESSESKLLTVGEICQYISSRFPFYRLGDEVWMSNVGYALRSQKCFLSTTLNLPSNKREGKPLLTQYWTIDEDYKARSRQGQKVQYHSFQRDTASSPDRIRKPPYSYTTLIAMAIEASDKKLATLSDIYKFIQTRFPYYQHTRKLWQNSIRHFLSVTKYFVKVPKENAGRGHYWTIGVPPTSKEYQDLKNSLPDPDEAMEAEGSDSTEAGDEPGINEVDMEPEVMIIEPEVNLVESEYNCLDPDVNFMSLPQEYRPLSPPPLVPTRPNTMKQPSKAGLLLQRSKINIGQIKDGKIVNLLPGASQIAIPAKILNQDGKTINTFVLKSGVDNKTIVLKPAGVGNRPLVMKLPVSPHSKKLPELAPKLEATSAKKSISEQIASQALNELKKKSRSHHPSSFSPAKNKNQNIDYQKPPFAFTTLISMAIENSPSGMATLGEIYDFIATRFPYFDMENKGWQNTVRHFLSVTNYFVKVPREGYKGNYWTIEQRKKKSSKFSPKMKTSALKKLKGKYKYKRGNEFDCTLCSYGTDDKNEAEDHMLYIHGIEGVKTSRSVANKKIKEEDSESTESCKEFSDSPLSPNGVENGKKCNCEVTPNLSCQVCSLQHDTFARSRLVTANNKNTALSC